jgi:hypothetical protein
MTPIVNRLEADFGKQIVFRRLNAADGAGGQQAFTQLALPGHPAFLIFMPDDREVYRSFGLIEEAALRDALIASLDAG